MKRINWIEAFVIDPRDGKEYYARVNQDDYSDFYKAYNAASRRAWYLAYRGFNEEDNYNDGTNTIDS
jgi:hypothetical protein